MLVLACGKDPAELATGGKEQSEGGLSAGALHGSVTASDHISTACMASRRPLRILDRGHWCAPGLAVKQYLEFGTSVAVLNGAAEGY